VLLLKIRYNSQGTLLTPTLSLPRLNLPSSISTTLFLANSLVVLYHFSCIPFDHLNPARLFNHYASCSLPEVDERRRLSLFRRILQKRGSEFGPVDLPRGRLDCAVLSSTLSKEQAKDQLQERCHCSENRSRWFCESFLFLSTLPQKSFLRLACLHVDLSRRRWQQGAGLKEGLIAMIYAKF